MRLHNRLIKASFWTDADLLQWPREKRWFYEGLIQLADDSGCLEDSPFAFKLQLFPSPLDADITVEAIEDWIQELVAQGKLIRYEIGGKACLYLNNFHKHQALRSPAAPDTPLPPWIKYTPSPKTRKSGIYEILTDSLPNPYANHTVTIRSSYGDQPEPEREPEREPEPERDTAASPDGDECDSAEPVTIKPEYSTEFEHFWSIYPKRLEKKAAYKNWNTRLKEKHHADDMILAATNYARLCAEQKTERKFIKHAATFLGPNKPFLDFVTGIPPDARGHPVDEPKGFQGIRDWLSGQGEELNVFE